MQIVLVSVESIPQYFNAKNMSLGFITRLRKYTQAEDIIL